VTDSVESGCPNPVFICGDFRSGTTALWLALRNHPNLKARFSTRKEYSFYWEFFIGRKEKPHFRKHAIDLVFERCAVSFINAFMTRHAGSETGRYVTSHPLDTLFIHKIIENLPGAKVLLLVRHPQEVLWSALHQPSYKMATNRTAKTVNDYTQEELARRGARWNSCAEVVVAALEGKYGPSVKVVRNEMLVSDPVGVVGGILDFIGEPRDETTLRVISSRITNSSFAASKADSSVVSHYEKVRSAISRDPRFCAWTWEVTQDLATTLGYHDLSAGIQSIASLLPEVEEFESPAVGPRSAAQRERFTALAVDYSKAPSGSISIESVLLTDSEGVAQSLFGVEETIELRIRFVANESVRGLAFSFDVHSGEGEPIFGTTTVHKRIGIAALNAGEHVTIRFSFPNLSWEGLHFVQVSAFSVSDEFFADYQLHCINTKAAHFFSQLNGFNPAQYAFWHPNITAEVMDAPACSTSLKESDRLRGMTDRNALTVQDHAADLSAERMRISNANQMSLVKQVEQLTGEMIAHVTEGAQLRAQLTEERREIGGIKAQLEETSEHARGLWTALKRERETVQNLKDELARMQGEQVVDRRQQLEELRAQLTRRHQQKEELRVQLVQRHEQIEELRAQVTRRHQQKEELRVQLGQRHQQLEELRARLMERSQRADDLRAQVHTLRQQAEEFAAQCVEQESQMSEFQEELVFQRAAAADAKRDLEGLRQSFSFKVGNLFVRCIPDSVRKLLTGRNSR